MAGSPTKSRPNFSRPIRRNSYRVTTSYNKIDPIKDSLSDVGFIDLRIAVLTREKHVADISAFARAMVYGNPLIDLIRTLDLGRKVKRCRSGSRRRPPGRMKRTKHVDESIRCHRRKVRHDFVTAQFVEDGALARTAFMSPTSLSTGIM